MSTLTEGKTLGQILFENMNQNPMATWENWLNETEKSFYEKAALAFRHAILPPQPTVKQIDPSASKYHKHDYDTSCPKCGGLVGAGIDHQCNLKANPADPVGVKTEPAGSVAAQMFYDRFCDPQTTSQLREQITVLQAERDQLRKEVEGLKMQCESFSIYTKDAEDRQERLKQVRDRLAGELEESGKRVAEVQKQLLEAHEEIEQVTVAHAQAETRYAAVCQERDSALAKLASLQWKPVPDTLPQCDKNNGDNLMCFWHNSKDEAKPVGVCWMDELHRHKASHFMPLPPVPAETEDEEFSAWAEKHDYLHQGSVTMAAKAAWQAALASRNNKD